MSRIFLLLTVACCLPLALLSGCGGGGGGGGAATTTLASFVKWSSITPPETVTIEGISQDATFTTHTTPGGVVTEMVDEGVSTSSSATLEYDSEGNLERVTIATPHTNATWESTSGDLYTDSGVVIMTDSAGANVGIAFDPLDPAINWEYQTFGVWETGRGTGSGTTGAITIGAPTTGSAIPVVGNTTFTGRAAGYYVDAPGTNDYLTASAITVNVDFANQALAFSSTGTRTLDPISLTPSEAPTLDMSGTLIYAAGTNSFTGTVTTTDLSLSGSSTGQFYGPNAEELGGVFFLVGDGAETYGGAYGAAQEVAQ